MIGEILRRPVSVIVATIALAALGAFALLKLPLSLLPQIERPSLVVTAKAVSTSRDELLQQVTAPSGVGSQSATSPCGRNSSRER